MLGLIGMSILRSLQKALGGLFMCYYAAKTMHRGVTTEGDSTCVAHRLINFHLWVLVPHVVTGRVEWKELQIK